MVKVESPETHHGVPPDAYDWDGLVELLRTHKSNPDAVQFIADMMAEALAPGTG
jgi:hypothetical protein